MFFERLEKVVFLVVRNHHNQIPALYIHVCVRVGYTYVVLLHKNWHKHFFQLFTDFYENKLSIWLSDV